MIDYKYKHCFYLFVKMWTDELCSILRLLYSSQEIVWWHFISVCFFGSQSGISISVHDQLMTDRLNIGRTLITAQSPTCSQHFWQIKNAHQSVKPGKSLPNSTVTGDKRKIMMHLIIKADTHHDHMRIPKSSLLIYSCLFFMQIQWMIAEMCFDWVTNEIK